MWQVWRRAEVHKSFWRRRLREKNQFGRPRSRWEDTVKINLKEKGRKGVNWVGLNENKDKQQVVFGHYNNSQLQHTVLLFVPHLGPLRFKLQNWKTDHAAHEFWTQTDSYTLRHIINLKFLMKVNNSVLFDRRQIQVHGSNTVCLFVCLFFVGLFVCSTTLY